MKVILKQDVKGLGRKGDLVTVAEGYGRNYLLPRGLAVEASEGAMRSLEVERSAERARQERMAREARALRDRLHGQTVRVPARVGEGGRLFGSVTARDVAEAIGRLTGSEFDRRKVELKEPIRSLGVFPVQVRLAPDVVAEVKVHVVEA
ncbi:50S ribosomal protein L9 [Caldinitratiruptor microaerophilus]|uniref:Large ribosomal subunit protein bL9 n=1 Tax=Caldinitratiruptor microaerophilus TaxID=671077 RepID=A0AA35CM38_9FIRM|nr:50S ribosomal protein L9 [Caldinitratiruptor microaerophilus]BDG61844.1 50S ribosomal protein L9 [Caldinitratiruptor microaerophilus]